MQEIHVYAVQPNGDFVLESPAPSAGERNSSNKPYTSVDVISFLTRRLPYSLPVLRLLQLGPRNPGTLVITTPLPLQGPVEGKGEEEKESLTTTVRPEHVWTMLVVDRANHPATEIWPFSSLEMYHGAAPHETGPQNAGVLPDNLKDQLPLMFFEEVLRTATTQLLGVISHIPVTWQDTTGAKSSAVLLANVRHTPGSPYCLFGNTHSTVAALLARAESDSGGGGLIHQPSVPYGKYVFPVPAKQQEGAEKKDEQDVGGILLPEGLVWSTIGPDDYADVMAVNKIIRSPTTLAKLKSAAIRETAPRPGGGKPGKAVAFAFAAGDGSVRTLHVDPAYRRQGLAKAVVAKLLGTGLFEPPRSGPLAARQEVLDELVSGKKDGDDDVGTALAFAGIEQSNTGSIKTFQALGGKWLWDVYWIYLDLDRARELAGPKSS
ncbi:hypothetical protein PG994_007108 [Apiospora phragmitis]|uniref:FR47-like domain-containing protein n=1 Tax=Apiospora phragmitis TaxID=2905665 RepID=A0ABR1UZW5_9PEZI